MKAYDTAAHVVERIRVANFTDVELVIEAERQLSWSNRPSPGNPHAPLGEILFCNAVVPAVTARLAGRPVRRLPGAPDGSRPIDWSRLTLDGAGEYRQATTEERRRAVALFRDTLGELPDKDLATTARFHLASCHGMIAGRGYDPRLARLILPEMIRRLAERRG